LFLDEESLNSFFKNLMESVPMQNERNEGKPQNLQESLEEAARMVGSQSSPQARQDNDEDEIIRKLMVSPILS
jgi:hypothetical protein